VSEATLSVGLAFLSLPGLLINAGIGLLCTNVESGSVSAGTMHVIVGVDKKLWI